MQNFTLVTNKPPADTVESQYFYLPVGSSINASGMSGADSVLVKIKVNNQVDYAQDSEGANVILTSTKRSARISAAGFYGVSVGATTGVINVNAVPEKQPF